MKKELKTRIKQRKTEAAQPQNACLQTHDLYTEYDCRSLKAHDKCEQELRKIARNRRNFQPINDWLRSNKGVEGKHKF